MGEAVKKSGQDIGREVALGVDRLVDTIWNQYEQSMDRVRELREKREDAYLKALKEVIKFNQEFRKSLTKLYQTSKKTNNEVVKGVSSNLLKKAEERNVVRQELTDQLEEVSNRAEKLAAAPIKAGLELIERFENNFVEGSENYVNYVRERRSGWQKVTNEYVKAARTNNKELVHRFEDSFKVLVNSK
jgi:predicted  nucleic acid-binding Zn-ribbon protein